MDKTNSGVTPQPKCNYRSGTLPECAPLAAAFVPFQQETPPTYEAGDALTRGTLFPGLDLPLWDIPNKTNPYAGTPLGEIMGLDFAIKELTLYLDTHKTDKEAFEMLKTYIALSNSGRKEYVRRFGPLTVRDLEHATSYTWIDGPWPWEFEERGADC